MLTKGVNIVVSSNLGKVEDMGSIHVNTRKHTLLQLLMPSFMSEITGR